MREQLREKDKLDLLIDSAIATYAEPSSGLEQRVLSTLAEERLAPPAKSKPAAFPIRRWIPWAVSLAAAACVFILFFVHHDGRPPETQARNPGSSQPLSHRAIAPPASAATEPTHVALARIPKPRAQHLALVQHAALPKLDVFPTPQPLSAQVRALVVVATQTPLPLRKALVDAQSQPDAPLRIAEISIPPIKPPDQVQP